MTKLFRTILSGVMATMLIVACSSETDDIGGSVTSTSEIPTIMTDTFSVKLSTVEAPSLYARNSTFYLGSLKDNATNEIIRSSYFTQFHALEAFSANMVAKSSITSKGDDGGIAADSCKIRIFFDNIMGDSTAHTTVNVYEAKKSDILTEEDNYYTDYDVIAEGKIRGLLASKTMEDSDTVKVDIFPTKNEVYESQDGEEFVGNSKFADKGSAFGTYILRKMYADPTAFNYSTKMTEKYLPGIYVTTTDANYDRRKASEAYMTQITVYYTYNSSGTSKMGAYVLPGTEENLQFNTIKRERGSDYVYPDTASYAFVKTPAGMFTMMELPINKIYGDSLSSSGTLISSVHAKDEINSAKLSFTGYTDDSGFGLPTTLLILPASALDTFFETPNTFLKQFYSTEWAKDEYDNYLDTYADGHIATLNTDNNTYTFADISRLCKYLRDHRNISDQYWNKVLIIPVTTEVNSSSETMSVEHNLGYYSGRFLKKGIKVSVFYTKHQ